MTQPRSPFPPPAPPSQKTEGSPLKDHFTQLRQCLIKSLLAIALTFVVCWFFSPHIMNIIRQPVKPFLKNTGGGLIFTAPLDQFLAHLQVSLTAALFLSSPYWLIQVWRFVAPGLYLKERKWFLRVWFLGFLLFCLGALFAVWVVFPLVFRLMTPFGGGPDQAFITLKNYLSFFNRSVLIFGLIFQMPLVLLTLCQTGVLSPLILRKYRKQAVVVLAVLSALITPPDLLSQILLLAPLVGLYELSILMTRLTLKT